MPNFCNCLLILQLSCVFFARKIGSVLCRVMQRECFGKTNLTMPSFVRSIVIAHELRSDQQYSACMAQHDTIPYSDIQFSRHFNFANFEHNMTRK